MPSATASNRREWKAGRRKELLAAADRVVRRTGPAASMDGMAAEAGISRVVLYRYFGDKAGLYEALAEHYVGELMTHLTSILTDLDDPQLRLQRTIDGYVRFIEENEEVYDFLMHRAIKEGPAAESTVADFLRGLATQIGEILAAEITRLGFSPAPALAWSHGLVGMVQLSTDWWLQSRTMPRETFVSYLVALLSHGFFGLASDADLAVAMGLTPLRGRDAR